MTTHTATRADRIPPGLCLIYAHGECPGGLAWKGRDGWVEQIADSTEWSIEPEDTPDHWGDPMVAIPRVLADHATDPDITAWAKSNVNQKEQS